MKVVFLDRETLGEGIDLSGLISLGEYREYPLTSKDEVFDRVREAEIIITNKVYFGKQQLDAAPKLKLICLSATGYNNVDLEEAKKRGIIVANVKDYSTESVAQTVFAYIFAFENRVKDYDDEVKTGTWARSPYFTFYKYDFEELRTKTIGIIGYGNIGKRVSEIAKAFGMKVMIAKSNPNKNYNDENRKNINEVLEKSDIITVHTPLNDSTKGLISRKELNIMKKNSIIINTARGGIVDEEALYEALLKKDIKGAACDVLTEEPPKSGNKLMNLDNIIITPHVAWASIQSRQTLVEGIVKNIEKYLQGKGKEICVY
jgi:glycerate dehydrogenase